MDGNNRSRKDNELSFFERSTFIYLNFVMHFSMTKD